MSKKQTTTSIKEDFISSLSANKQHLLALLIILLLPILLFDDASIGGKQFMGHDTIQWRASAESIIEYRATHNEEPLWATNMFSGMPAYVISVERSVPHIDGLIRSLTDSIFPVAQYWILMAGAYLLFILMKIRPLSALLGSIFISLTTYIPIIIGAGHNNKFLAFIFIPWVLIGYWLFTRHDKKLLSFSVFAIALTLEFRAGHPQVTYYFIYLLGFWWIYDTWLAYREDRLRPWLKTTALLALAGIIGLLGNAQQYWRFMEYSPYSIRGGSALAEGSAGLALDYAFRWSQGVGELLTLIIPGLFGGASSQAYWGPKPVTSGPHYLGAVAFILALIGLIRSRHKLKYLFFGTGTLTLLFSLGHHFELFNRLMFNYVPYFDKFRTPEMWLLVTVFCYSVVGVFGIEYVIESAKKKVPDLKTLYLPLGIAIGMAVLFAFGNSALLSFEKPGERQQYEQQLARQNNISPQNPQVQQRVSSFMNNQLKPQRKELADQDSMRFLILTLIVCGLIAAFYMKKIGPGYLLIGLILVASYDYLSVGDRYTNEQSMVSENIDITRAIAQQKRQVDEYLQENVASGNGWPYRVFPLDSNPFNNAIPSYYYPAIGGYTGAKLSYYQDLIDELLLTEQRSFNFPVLDMLNVRYITYNQSLPFPELEQVYAGDNSYVFENKGVLPKAFYVDTVRTVTSAHEAVNSLKPSSRFNPSHTAIVEGNPDLQIKPDTAASVAVTHYDARSIELETSRSTPGFLVLSEIYYPKGWQLTVDGEPAEIYKTNYVLRGMKVPAGEHTLRMEFNPKSYIWGGRIAWGSNLLQWSLMLLALAFYWRERKGAAASDETGEKEA